MAVRPKKQHTYPLSDNGYAAPGYNSRPEYHTARWTRMSRIFRNRPENALCARCKAQGVITPAKVVDHIIPAEICGDFWNEMNWQPLCIKCNNIKAAEDRLAIQKHKQKNGN